jgi:protein tyrosine phosphatase (PTP) superfamily phosphohydrolase (DUF442 family)
MFDRHAVLRQELNQAKRFLHTVKAHRDRTSPASSPTPDDFLQHVSVALEDIPEDMHESVRMILMHPADNASLRERIADVAENVAGHDFGDIEIVAQRLSLLHILSSLSIHSPYTYRVDSKVLRGSRPTPDKLRRLHAGDCRATINLCREMPRGDDDLIRAAGLTGEMTTTHIPITDNSPPTTDDVIELLSFLKSYNGTVYIHCEAGVGRTGVMVACYRMDQGWTLENALHEARQFGCAMPDQLAFIEDRATAAASIPGWPGAQPSTDVLSQNAAMNKDLHGLERALKVVAELAGGPVVTLPSTVN